MIVKKIGGSMAVVIPMAVARDMGLTEGTPLVVSGSDAAIVLRKRGRRPRRPLAKILAKINPASYRHRARELSDDRPVGREVW